MAKYLTYASLGALVSSSWWAIPHIPRTDGIQFLPAGITTLAATIILAIFIVREWRKA